MRAQSGAPDGGVVSSEGKARTGSRIKGRRKAPRFKAIGTFVKRRFSRLRGFSDPDVTPALLPQ
jgi:hypothetical protein